VEQPEEKVLQDCLGPLMMHLRRCGEAYRRYTAEGMTYRWALVLWEANTTMRAWLLERGYLLPAELQDAATRIISHIDIWSVLWVRHRDEHKPGLDDVFAFENQDRFPSDAEQALGSAYERLRRAGNR
jgi:hypothetical protein